MRSRSTAGAVKFGLGLVLLAGLSQWAVGQQAPAVNEQVSPHSPGQTADDGEQPSSAIIVLPPGIRPQTEIKDDQSARARIAEMLQRGQQQNENSQERESQNPGAHSGNPILNDVLEVIRKRGSVLDGSSLDEMPHEPLVTEPLERAIGEVNDVNDHRYQTAESLLRSARLLQRMESQDQAQADLIHAMRRRAMSLMIQAMSSEQLSRPRQAN